MLTNMTTRFKRGIIDLSLATIVGVAGFLSGWSAWNSIKAIDTSEKVAGQEVKIDNLTASLGDIKAEIKNISETSQASKAYGEWIITNLGQNPETLWKRLQ